MMIDRGNPIFLLRESDLFFVPRRYKRDFPDVKLPSVFVVKRAASGDFGFENRFSSKMVFVYISS